MVCEAFEPAPDDDNADRDADDETYSEDCQILPGRMLSEFVGYVADNTAVEKVYSALCH